MPRKVVTSWGEVDADIIEQYVDAHGKVVSYKELNDFAMLSAIFRVQYSATFIVAMDDTRLILSIHPSASPKVKYFKKLGVPIFDCRPPYGPLTHLQHQLHDAQLIHFLRTDR